MFDDAAYIVYDGECVFCSQYVKFLRLRDAIGPVKLVSAREDHPVVRYLKSKGVDLNQEMALVMHGEIHSGPDCMNRLALMSTGAGFFNALTARIFASRGVSRALYPALRAGRNLTLRLRGQAPIA